MGGPRRPERDLAASSPLGNAARVGHQTATAMRHRPVVTELIVLRSALRGLVRHVMAAPVSGVDPNPHDQAG